MFEGGPTWPADRSFIEANDIHAYVYRFETNLVLTKDVVIKQSSILDF